MHDGNSGSEAEYVGQEPSAEVHLAALRMVAFVKPTQQSNEQPWGWG